MKEGSSLLSVLWPDNIIRSMKKISKYLLPFSYRFTIKTKDIQVIQGRYLISNVVGSSNDRGSKKLYWERHAKSKFYMCQVDQCRRQASVGAHVWIRRPQSWSWSTSPTDRTVFILPLCQKCNLSPSMTNGKFVSSKKSAVFVSRTRKYVQIHNPQFYIMIFFIASAWVFIWQMKKMEWYFIFFHKSALKLSKKINYILAPPLGPLPCFLSTSVS